MPLSNALKFKVLRVLRDLRSSLRPRVLASLRSDLPCLAPALGMITGQLCALCCDQRQAICCLLLLLPLACLPRRRWLVFCLLPGLLSGRLAAPPRAGCSGEVLLRARVDAAPRHPHPGEALVSLRIVEAIEAGARRAVVASLQGRRLLCRSVDLPWRNSGKLREGDLTVVHAALRSFDGRLFSYQGSLARRGYIGDCRVIHAGRPLHRQPSLLQRLRARVVRKVRRHAGDGERSGMFLAAALGARDTLSSRTEWAFKRCGLAHLLVFSGYQITVLYYFLTAFARAPLPLALRTAVHWTAFVFSALLIAFVGVEGSSLRAGAAALLIVAARSYERGGGMLHAILVAFLVLALAWPGCYLEPGVQLTFAALAGICAALAAPGCGGLRCYLRVCWFASLFTTPLVIGWFGYLSLVGFLLNPLLAPLIAFISCKLGFLALAALLLGIDGQGRALAVVCTLLDPLRRLVLAAAEWPAAGWQLEGPVRVLGTLVAFLPVLWIVRERWLDYLLERNLLADVDMARPDPDRNHVNSLTSHRRCWSGSGLGSGQGVCPAPGTFIPTKYSLT